MPDLTVIVLAAGGGTRMKSKTMKVLHPIAGRSMIGHVLTAVAAVEPTRVVAVVGHQREQVGPHIEALVPGRRARGAGEPGRHRPRGPRRHGGARPGQSGTVIVTTGDTPLLEGASLRAFAEDHTGCRPGGEHPDRGGARTRSATDV